MSINSMIKTQMSKSNGQVEIVKVPDSKRLSLESLIKLDHEINFWIQRNERASRSTD